MFILDFELITSEHTQCSIDALFPFPYINAFFRTNVQKYNIYIYCHYKLIINLLTKAENTELFP